MAKYYNDFFFNFGEKCSKFAWIIDPYIRKIICFCKILIIRRFL